MTFPGYDNVDVKIVKRYSHIISPYLQHIINKLLQEEVFPKWLQIAKVVPIHKKGEKSRHDNYRSILMLPCFSKVFEKIMASRFINYLTTNSLISEYQFGFRPNYSAE